MRHELSTVEKQVLLGAVGDIQRLKQRKQLIGTNRVTGYFAFETAVLDAKNNCVRLDAGRWLDQVIEPSDRMMISRAYARLERRGLVERVNFSDEQRATHLEITRAGFKVARELQVIQKK